MTVARSLAIVSNLLAAVGFAATGVHYLLADRLMPYHLDAMGVGWDALSPGMRSMSLNFMKSAGAGFLTTGIAAGLLVVMPFRRGEVWSRWVVFTVLACQFCLILTRMIDVAATTPGRPLFAPFLVLGALILAGLVLSRGMEG